MDKFTGTSVNRVDGRLKVTGAARYVAETKIENLAYAVLTGSRIAKGRVTTINTAAAENAPGVVRVFTHLNLPKLAAAKMYPEGGTLQTFLPMQTDAINYAGQPIALVVAETLEQAEYAAGLVRAVYSEEKPACALESELERAFSPKEPFDKTRGNPKIVFDAAGFKLEAVYTTPVEHHNPIESPITIAAWDNDRLTVYESTQWVAGVQTALSEWFAIPKEHIRVVSTFVGGAFGGKSVAMPHTALATAAARILKRPVKLELRRREMFWSNGARPATHQKVKLAANANGKLAAIVHDIISHTSQTDDFAEGALTETTQMLYACPNVAVSHKITGLNVITPNAMRAPGEAVCLFAIDSAMDELAYQLKLDPLEFRLRNYAEKDLSKNLPFSSKALRECYRRASDRFGWQKRKIEPRLMREGNEFIGWGMSSSTYPVYLSPATARVRLSTDGTALVQTASHDLGTGAYTALTIIAADALGLPIERVRCELGDTRLPKTPIAAGSRSTASVGAAVQAAAEGAKAELIKLAVADKSSAVYAAKPEAIVFENGQLSIKGGKSETFGKVLKRNKRQSIEAYRETMPPEATAEMRQKILSGLDGAAVNPSNSKQFSRHSFGAHFVEVRIDEMIGRIRVSRIVSAFGAGRIINLKTATSQIKGAIVMGLGMALTEETVADPNTARIVTATLGDYHVPVQADVPDITAFFVEEQDEQIGALGAKGVGEIGLVGIAAAIANAVFHATGKRIRELPITPDKLL